jgi:flagellar basal body rod protein FlgG
VNSRQEFGASGRARQISVARPPCPRSSYRPIWREFEHFDHAPVSARFVHKETLDTMDTLTAAAASGLRARMESLDLLANNLANTATAGYKADREFYSLYVDAEAQQAETARESPIANFQPLVEKPWIDLSPASLQQTGRSLDLALSGPGFFAVDGPAGPLYTRNGSFQVTPSGAVTTAEGYPIRLEGGQTLKIDPERPFIVASDGGVQQGGTALGRLEIANFPGAEMQKLGNSYFKTAAAAAPAAGVAVHQGKLETSNVTPAQSAVRLVAVMRQFEMLQKAIGMGGEMNRKAIEEVARPT